MLKFGIIMPTYNRPDGLKRAISSVVGNDYENWLLSVVDDGSKTYKENEAVIEAFHNEKIYYKRLSSNSGVNKARNEALELLLSLGCDYIVLLDDDDMFVKDALLIANETIRANPDKQWYVFNTISFSGKKITKMSGKQCRVYIEDLIRNDTIGDATHFIERDLIGKLRFSKIVKQGKEWLFFAKLKSCMSLFDKTTTKIEYIQGGLTSNERKEIAKYSSFRYLIKKKSIEFFLLPILRMVSPYKVASILVFVYELFYKIRKLTR